MAPPMQRVGEPVDLPKEGSLTEEQTHITESTESSQDIWAKRKDNFKKGAIVTSIVGIGAYVQFKQALELAKQKGDPEELKNLRVQGPEFKLATRALALGTLYAVVGTGLLVFVIKTTLGVNSFKEFGDKMRKIYPEIKKKPKKEGEEVIETVGDLAAYFKKNETKKTKQRPENIKMEHSSNNVNINVNVPGS